MHARLSSLVLTALSALFLKGIAGLQAQVEEVTFTWQTPLCPVSCEQLLQRELSKINGVAKITLTPGAGAAALEWKPNVPFSFFPLNAATRMVGIRIHNVHVKVHGTIQGGNNYSMQLRSDGDGTLFNLISPPAMQPDQAVALYNPQAYPLSEPLRLQLTEQMRVRQPVTIQGNLMEPERAPPLYLIVESVTLDDKSKPGAHK